MRYDDDDDDERVPSCLDTMIDSCKSLDFLFSKIILSPGQKSALGDGEERGKIIKLRLSITSGKR